MPDNEKGPLLEGIYRTRLKTQPPAEWKDLGKEERTAKMRADVIKFWSTSDVLLRQLGQDRASSIKDYLVDKGQLADDRVYFIDAQLGEAEKDGKVVTPTAVWTPKVKQYQTMARIHSNRSNPRIVCDATIEQAPTRMPGPVMATSLWPFA